MYDRIPSPGKENRVSITQDNGQVITGVLAYADDATQEGSAYTKGNVLPDSVLSLIGLPTESSEPADMFNVLATAGDLHVWRRTTSSGTDYPVSVNPNAYQEGSDAQPAGYTLGDVVSGNTLLAQGQNSGIVNIYTADTLTVNNDGTISVDQFSTRFISYLNGSNLQQTIAAIKGKFFCITTNNNGGIVTDLTKDAAYFATSNVSVTQSFDSHAYMYIQNYQPVTGYPAIPAGTTIEYMGKLGDKARMQIVSYVGTGTYGASNPCSITADFPIKSATLLGYRVSSNNLWGNSFRGVTSIVSEELTNRFSRDIGFTADSSASNTLAKISEDEKTISWYHLSSSEYQLNSSGYKYYFLFRG